MAKLLEYWKRLSVDIRFAVTVFLVARVTLSLWSLVLFAIFPVALQNLDLFGEPVLTVFILRTSEEHVYSRRIGDEVLTFHAIDSGNVVDDQTGSVWSISSGKAWKGKYIGESLIPDSGESIFPYLGVPPSKNAVLSVWQRFDTNWYLRIAERGYQGLAGSTAYFPLYPILIRLLSFIVEPMMAAVFISNIALIGVLAFLCRLVTDLVGEQVARRTVIYVLVFPASFFLMAAYTEPLFLLFAIGSLYVASHRHWWWAVILGVLSTLTRLQGVLLFFPLVYMVWNENKTLPLKDIFRRALPLGMIPTATLIFFVFSNFSMVNSLQSNWRASFVFPWENIWASVSLLMNHDGSIIDAMNLIVTLGFIAMLFAIWRKLPVEYLLYSIFMLFTPLFRMNATQPLVSMTRYVLVIFPVFIVFGMWGKNPWVNRAILYVSVLLQLYLSAQFFLWGWVA